MDHQESKEGWIRWFGKSWGAALCREAPHMDVPVGEVCCHCDEMIAEDDQGIQYSNGPLAHLNCFLRQTTGSVAHLLKRCSCFVPGSTEDDPPGMTKRQAADAAVAVFDQIAEEDERASPRRVQ